MKTTFTRRTWLFKHTAALWETLVQSCLLFPHRPVVHHSHRLWDSLPISLLVAVNFLKVLDDVDLNFSLSHLTEHSPSQYIIFWYWSFQFWTEITSRPWEILLKEELKKSWQLWLCQMNIGKTMSLQNFQPDALLKCLNAAKQAELCYAGKGHAETRGKCLIFTAYHERSSGAGSLLAG